MAEEKLIVMEPRDYRKSFAGSLVADLEAYASKRGLFLGKKEWTQHSEWESLHVKYKLDKHYVDAILFSGIVSQINGLEYVILYESHRSHFEIYMCKPERRETYDHDSNPEWGISMFPDGYKDGDVDCLFGNEFKSLHKEVKELCHSYQDLSGLLDYDHGVEHISEGALDGIIDAFKHAEEKHVRRMKNYKDLDSKEDRLREQESKKTDIIYELSPMVCDVKRFKKLDLDFYPSRKMPIQSRFTIDTGIERTKLECYLSYTSTRKKFSALIMLEEVVGEGEPTDSGYWRSDEAHWEPIEFCGEEMNYTVTGDLRTVANHLLYALDLVKVCTEAKKNIANLKDLYNITDPDED